MPVFFVLSFFVDTIVQRWWEQFQKLAWPDELAMTLSAYTHGDSERIRLQRRTFMRYINLAYVIATRNMSSSVRRRFPTEAHLVSSGITK